MQLICDHVDKHQRTPLAILIYRIALVFTEVNLRSITFVNYILEIILSVILSQIMNIAIHKDKGMQKIINFPVF